MTNDDDDAKSVASLTKELKRTKQQLKSTKNCLVAVCEVSEDLTDDEEGSNSLLAELRLRQASPQSTVRCMVCPSQEVGTTTRFGSEE